MRDTENDGDGYAERDHHRNPEEDPFACSRCGDALSSLERLNGDYCRLCRREINEMLGIPEGGE